MPETKRPRVALFTTYKLATGSQFPKMRAALAGRTNAPELELKSRDAHLSSAHEQALEKFLAYDRSRAARGRPRPKTRLTSEPPGTARGLTVWLGLSRSDHQEPGADAAGLARRSEGQRRGDDACGWRRRGSGAGRVRRLDGEGIGGSGSQAVTVQVRRRWWCRYGGGPEDVTV